MWQVGTLVLLLSAACSFDGSVGASTDAALSIIDADPNTPDADITSEVRLLDVDALNDGTAAAFVVGYDGRVYIGPSADGSSLRRYAYNGGGGLLINMTFPADSDHDNSSTPPYQGIGYMGCMPDDDCGPHNEDLRGYLTAGVVDGTEWLILGGAKSGGDLEHIYMSSDTGTGPATMLYVDLKTLLGANTKGLSTAKVLDGHVYLGFADTGGARPYMLDLLVGPTTAPGLDGIDEGTDVFDLLADDMPAIGSGDDDNGHAMIDAIGSFLGLLNFGNDTGWVHSRREIHPPPYPGPADDDYDDSTPDNDEYGNKASVETLKVGDILPVDRALINMVEYKSRLYAARNTTSGPQLWRCNPAGMNCDANDWTLVAPNLQNDVELSQFDNTNNTAVTLLQSTGTHLYVGFDNGTDGVVVYRTDVDQPSGMADFVGDANCQAGAGCAGLGGNGFGRSENKQFLDSESIDIGGGDLDIYALVGDAIAPLNLYRFATPL